LAVSVANPAGTRAGARDRDAWTLFWADSAQSRCAAGAPEIWQSLLRHWTSFAGSLPRGARVLDLGCGAGAVGRMLLAARDDVQVTGIDAAKVPGSKLPQMRLLSETDMESLPFDDGSFDAVVSQFGYEYSHTTDSAREVARVLAPGASLSFLVHHSQSAVVNANRERHGAVVAFLAPTMRSSFCAGDATDFNSRIALLVERYPDDALIAQLAHALPSRLGWMMDRRVSTWESLEEALAPEMCFSKSLDACCVDPSRIDAWVEPLRTACNLLPITILREPDGTPIAWCAEGARDPQAE
jgi:ubiquinone/menaquinone biosynthesis C-methylase UbiE